MCLFVKFYIYILFVNLYIYIYIGFEIYGKRLRVEKIERILVVERVFLGVNIDFLLAFRKVKVICKGRKS